MQTAAAPLVGWVWSSGLGSTSIKELLQIGGSGVPAQQKHPADVAAGRLGEQHS